MAAVRVVELDEDVEAMFGICIALAALEDLVRRGCFMGPLGFGPRQQVGIEVLGVCAPLLVVDGVVVIMVVVLVSWLRVDKCMTA